MFKSPDQINRENAQTIRIPAPPVTPDGSRPLRVVLISHSDILGGAGVVTYRLMHALRNAGIDARMLAYTRLTDEDVVQEITTRNKRSYRFLMERASIFLANGFNRKDLFKVSFANTGSPVWEHPWTKEADVIMLNWVNQGLLSLKGIGRLGSLGKTIIWTMHDMWCMTGICHHSLDCEHYLKECGRCTFLHSSNPNDASHKVWLKKKALYESVPITFVAGSNWLADRARSSSLLHDCNLRVIPNAVPVETFLTEPTHTVQSLHVDYSRDLILMGAARLDDPIKGIDYAIDALNYLFDNNPKIANRCSAVFFGDIRDRSVLDRLRFPYSYLGRINDRSLLRQLYANAKVVISTSLYETLPGTLIEGQAAGCIPVSFDRGGQRDIIEHKVNGYLAEYKNPQSVANGILWALSQDNDRRELHEEVKRKFSSEVVADRYINLINELLSKEK